MGTGSWTLTVFKIPIGRADHPLIGQPIGPARRAHRTTRFQPLETGLTEYPINTQCFSFGFYAA
jgi:hypothetical protein